MNINNKISATVDLYLRRSLELKQLYEAIETIEKHLNTIHEDFNNHYAGYIDGIHTAEGTLGGIQAIVKNGELEEINRTTSDIEVYQAVKTEADNKLKEALEVYMQVNKVSNETKRTYIPPKVKEIEKENIPPEILKELEEQKKTRNQNS